MEKEDINIVYIEKKVKKGLPLEFFFTLLKVFNPNSYTELSHRTMKNVISYFISILFLSYVLMILISLPLFSNFQTHLNKEFSKFDEFAIDLKISMNKPIYIKQLNIGIDATGDKNLTNENILITKNYIQAKPLICFFKPACFFRNDITKVSLDEYDNVLEKREEFVSLIYLLTLFLLPWILISLFIILLMKYLFLALILTILGIVLIKIINQRIGPKKIFKISIYSLTPMIILDTINIPVGLNLFYIPFVISLFYFIIGLISSSERGYKR